MVEKFEFFVLEILLRLMSVVETGLRNVYVKLFIAGLAAAFVRDLLN